MAFIRDTTKFSTAVRTAFCIANAIESLISSYPRLNRQMNRQRSNIPKRQTLLKALYLATFETTKKWSMPIRNWGKVRGEFSLYTLTDCQHNIHSLPQKTAFTEKLSQDRVCLSSKYSLMIALLCTLYKTNSSQYA